MIVNKNVFLIYKIDANWYISTIFIKFNGSKMQFLELYKIVLINKYN